MVSVPLVVVSFNMMKSMLKKTRKLKLNALGKYEEEADWKVTGSE